MVQQRSIADVVRFNKASLIVILGYDTLGFCEGIK
jgi:hypothetical protein